MQRKFIKYDDLENEGAISPRAEIIIRNEKGYRLFQSYQDFKQWEDGKIQAKNSDKSTIKKNR